MNKMKDHHAGGRNIALSIFAVSITFQSGASVIINEIDYDQPGADSAEFIELYNTGSNDISLDSYAIDLINGSDGSTYESIDLTGFSIAADDYLVICSDMALVTNCDYDFTSQTSWFQNGAPDGLALYEGANLIDSLMYEGGLSPFTEGSALMLADSGTDTASISRLPDGMDSNNNAIDFDLGCITPGSANISGSGDCSLPSAVPLPAAAWLFASGLVGLIGVARKQHKAL